MMTYDEIRKHRRSVEIRENTENSHDVCQNVRTSERVNYVLEVEETATELYINSQIVPQCMYEYKAIVLYYYNYNNRFNNVIATGLENM